MPLVSDHFSRSLKSVGKPLQIMMKKTRKSITTLRIVTIFLLVTIVTLLYELDNYYMVFSEVTTSNERVTQLPKQSNILLVWTSFFGSEDWRGKVRYYPECDCLITRDRSYLPLSKAVLFHWRDTYGRDLPVKYAGQKWVWHLEEPPMYTRRKLFVRYIARYFDCWATYRLDSDFPMLYGCFTDLLPSDFRPKRVSLKSKPKSVAWLASDCDVSSKREEYVHLLSQHIPVDIYGKCGSNCDNQNVSCHKFLEANYKFYLSFENSICKDYLTEKVLNLLPLDIIPVVMGGADYRSLLPPRSHINVADFQSPKHLADYLHRLSEDEEQYNSYFQWKTNYTPSPCPNMWCEMCHKLNSEPEYRCKGESHDLVKWWYDGANCTDYHGKPQIIDW